MALEALTARANTGTGTDQLAVVNTASGKAGAVALVDDAGALVSAANPLPVDVAFPETQPVSAAALPLPTGAATEATLASLNTKIANTPSGALLTGTARDRFFDNFHDFNTVDDWEVVQTGTGMTISGPLGGAVAGASPYLNIASGTTANQKTVILSRAAFNMPVDLRYQITASQRIANNRLIIGFVQVDPATGAILTSTAYATAPDVQNARNAVVHQHDGTVATTANLRVRAAGAALDTFANAFGTGFTTVATGTGPNWLSATTYGLTMERDKISSRAYGQNVTTNTGGQFSYDRVLVNPTALYKLIIIVENQAAPASTTDWRLHLINVLDATRFDVSPRNAGTVDGAKSFPIWGAGGSIGVSGTVTATVGTSISGGTISPLTVAGASAEASAARTTSGSSAAALTNASGRSAHFFVNVTAATGTSPTLVVRVQIQDPVSSNWIDLPGAATASITGTGLTLLTVNNLPRTYRLAWTIGGTTPSFTFSVGIAPVI